MLMGLLSKEQVIKGIGTGVDMLGGLLGWSYMVQYSYITQVTRIG